MSIRVEFEVSADDAMKQLIAQMSPREFAAMLSKHHPVFAGSVGNLLSPKEPTK